MSETGQTAILYRGSRDELNEMCRVKDERIKELEAQLAAHPPSVSQDRLVEALRMILSCICLDTEDDCREVSRALGIEDANALWEIAREANDLVHAARAELEKKSG